MSVKIEGCEADFWSRVTLPAITTTSGQEIDKVDMFADCNACGIHKVFETYDPEMIVAGVAALGKATEYITEVCPRLRERYFSQSLKTS